MESVAAVFREPGLPLTLERIPWPELGPGEAMVRIRCATICGSDLHSVFGRRRCPVPSVLGHEMTATLVAGDVRDFQGEQLTAGERVTWSMVWSCGECYYCERELASRCERVFKFGHERIGGGRGLTGAYAEHCFLPVGTAIFRIPANVPDVVAAPANCATATAAAVVRRAGDLAGRNVLVMGAGMLGLTACAMASAAGAAHVIAVERDERRRALAERFGATLALPAGEGVMAATAGRGVDVALEFAGTPEACEAAIGLLRAGGHLVMAGAVFPSRPLALGAEDFVRRQLRMTGVYNYQPADLGQALRFLSDTMERFPFAELVGGRYRLADINEALAFAETEKPPRAALVFKDEHEDDK